MFSADIFHVMVIFQHMGLTAGIFIPDAVISNMVIVADGISTD